MLRYTDAAFIPLNAVSLASKFQTLEVSSSQLQSSVDQLHQKKFIQKVSFNGLETGFILTNRAISSGIITNLKDINLNTIEQTSALFRQSILNEFQADHTISILRLSLKYGLSEQQMQTYIDSLIESKDLIYEGANLVPLNSCDSKLSINKNIKTSPLLQEELAMDWMMKCFAESKHMFARDFALKLVDTGHCHFDSYRQSISRILEKLFNAGLLDRTRMNSPSDIRIREAFSYRIAGTEPQIQTTPCSDQPGLNGDTKVLAEWIVAKATRCEAPVSSSSILMIHKGKELKEASEDPQRLQQIIQDAGAYIKSLTKAYFIKIQINSITIGYVGKKDLCSKAFSTKYKYLDPYEAANKFIRELREMSFRQRPRTDDEIAKHLSIPASDFKQLKELIASGAELEISVS